MLMRHPMELLGTSWVLLAGLLVPLSQAAEAVGPLERKAAAVGSSVLLPGPGNVTHIYFTQWEYFNGTSSRTILQYYRGSHSPAIHAPYTGRAIFHPFNGSLLLEDVQESDSGTYKVTVNVGDKESLKILLEVLKPVSRPQLRTSALMAQASGEVFCKVAEGRVDTIAWKKDRQPLPPDRGFRLSNSLSILYLRPAKKSDCGSYSCNASNGISWQETSLNITIAGLSPPLQDVLRIAVVAVVFAAVSGWGIIFPVCQSEKLRISPSIAIILPEIALTYVMVVTFLVSATVTFQPTKFIQLRSKTAQRTMGYAAPGGVVSVVLTTSFLIKNIHNRHEEGCTEFVDVTTLAVSTAAVSALPLLAILLCCPLKCLSPAARMPFPCLRGQLGCSLVGRVSSIFLPGLVGRGFSISPSLSLCNTCNKWQLN
ncbi:endothelial cell-selective adhesion molecule isoform X6 [Columba livia]|uniref:endothelial cell-selective adhesion molecule isoform X6 n=1 Tax=Columba livia TaxID=8932 RepID=UPI0031BB3403